jgi:hypothetical protein
LDSVNWEKRQVGLRTMGLWRGGTGKNVCLTICSIQGLLRSDRRLHTLHRVAAEQARIRECVRGDFAQLPPISLTQINIFAILRNVKLRYCVGDIFPACSQKETPCRLSDSS